VLEAWRVTAELAAATGWDDVETAATRRAARVVQQSGDHAPQVGRFLDGELARLAHR
jgi:hypothetical protein